ncbi:hypothetical protein [Pseudoramibacter alactolyticus]|uniref:hypothetical protein n=1 Tax=Pseudoramibacter alactolyticus TaxID=113287 RepID=UPI0028E52293|nr:hypothetical protein [Pseudoramibacter alactolyticus]
MNKQMEKDNRRGGIGALEVIQLILIALKIFRLIKLSWLAVLTPTWISIGLVTILVITYFLL